MKRNLPRLELRSPGLLTEVMAARGLTNRALADDALVALSTVAQLRSGLRSRCSVPAAKRICRTLHVPMDLVFMPPGQETSQ